MGKVGGGGGSEELARWERGEGRGRGAVRSWQGQKGARVVRWQGGKGGRMVKWQGGRFPDLAKAVSFSTHYPTHP